MQQTYRYLPDNRRKRTLIRAIVLLIFGGIPLSLALNSLVIPRALIWVLLFLPLIWLSILVVTAILATTADLTLTPEALEINMLGPWVIRIPASAAKIMLIEEVTPPLHIRLITRSQWHKVHLISVAGVGILALVGLYYGAGRVPVFVLTPDHNNYQDLIRRLEHHKHPLNRKKPGHTLYRDRKR